MRGGAVEPSVMMSATRLFRRGRIAHVATAAACAVAALTAVPAGAAGHGAAWRITTLPVGASYSEPGLAAGPHRTLLANACTANAGGPATYWRSSDDGRSWSRGFTIGTSAIGCGDADTAIGSDGWSYALVLGTGVDVYRSRDGKRWSGPASLPPPHGEDQPDRPWLVTVPQHPNVVYLFNSEIGGNVVVWTSTDHAATFTGPTLVTGGPNSQAALAIGSRPLVDPLHPTRLRMFYETAGFAAVASSVGSSGPTQFPFAQLWQASSSDGGRSWTNSLVVDVTTTFGQSSGSLGHLLPATAVDRNGTVYVVLSVQLGNSSETHLYLLHSTRNGGWTTPVRVDRAGASNVYPAVAVMLLLSTASRNPAPSRAMTCDTISRPRGPRSSRPRPSASPAMPSSPTARAPSRCCSGSRCSDSTSACCAIAPDARCRARRHAGSRAPPCSPPARFGAMPTCSLQPTCSASSRA